MSSSYPFARALAVAGAVVLINSLALAANIVRNPGFENRLNDWRVTLGATDLSNVYATSNFRGGGAHQGLWMLAAEVNSTTSSQTLNTGDASVEQTLPNVRVADIKEVSTMFRGGTTSGYMLALVGFTDGSSASQIVVRYYQTFNNWTKIDLTKMVKTPANRDKRVARIFFYFSEAWSYSSFALDTVVVDVADAVNVAGNLSLGDYVGSTPPLFTVELRPVAGGENLRFENVAIGADGSFTVNARGLGAHTVHVRGGSFLGAVSPEPVALGFGNLTIPTIALINGDVDGDNAVTVFDYDDLSNAFDSRPGDPNWNVRADLDGDGSVTVFDYDVLSNNFDRIGVS